MSIKKKISTITNFIGNIFGRNKGYGGYSGYGGGYSASPGIGTITKEIFLDFIEKYKGVRRTILFIVVWINVHIYLTTIYMYKTCQTVDTQWVVFAGYWAGIFGTFVAFYTMSRVKEYNSDTPYSRPGQWMGQTTSETYSVTDYTKEDDPPFYDEGESINGDKLVENGGDLNSVES